MVKPAPLNALGYSSNAGADNAALSARSSHVMPTKRPPLAQQVEHLRRQHDIAVLAALGLLDPNDLLRAVDMLDLQPDHLAGAQAAAIAETEQRADLEVVGDGEQTPRIAPTECPGGRSGATMHFNERKFPGLQSVRHRGKI